MWLVFRAEKRSFCNLFGNLRSRYESNMLDTIGAFIVMQNCDLMLGVEQFGSRLDTIGRTVGIVRNMQIRRTLGTGRQKQ